LRPDHQEFADGVKLAAIAAVSAVLTATVVVGSGRAFSAQREFQVVASGLTPAVLR